MLVIEPAEMIFNVQQRVRSQNVFDDFFGSVQNVQTKVSSKRIPIVVNELPSPPTGFYGAVGKFSLSSSIDKTEIKIDCFRLPPRTLTTISEKYIWSMKFNITQ